VRRRIPYVRRATQAASLALFVYLLVSARNPLKSVLPVDLFARMDPLAQLSSSLAARTPTMQILWALPLLLAALLLGRFFCGWICPMGTTLDLFRLRKANPPRSKGEAGLRRTKYLILIAVLAAALAGSSFLMPLDPITLITRSFAAFIYPAFNAVTTGTLFALYDHGILQDMAVWVDTELRGNLLPLQQPYFRLSWLFLLILAGVIALNARSHRFWCRYLCPLGAMMGLLSRPSLLGRRVSAGCSKCDACLTNCRVGAIEPGGYASDGGECILCGDCAAICPKSAISYGGMPASGHYDPSRRGLLAVGGLAALSVAGLRVDSPSQEVNPFLVRPPGARNADFLARCVRCGQCIKSCPSSGLQPSLFQSGIEGLWSPILVSRIGPCQYDCTTCGEVCPTGAIESLELEAKHKTIIGTAYVDQKRCIPWADNRNCIVCEELCPVSPKAVELDPVDVLGTDGKPTTIKRPRVVRDRCIGCGICEKVCPLPGEAAIRVYNTSALLTEGGDVLPPDRR
jgi:MauM/NapG family ferredoxin protein